jgi:hypothetical protein
MIIALVLEVGIIARGKAVVSDPAGEEWPGSCEFCHMKENRKPLY